ncbi:MAG TPA: IS3 family transposase [Bacteroidia bacterium]|nr:IS3 family transposase [Bacteroidia bacterium]
MKTTRFTEAQIVAALKEFEAGKSAADICRGLGINKQTFYNWKNKYSGMETQDLRRLKELEDENRKLKQMYAELAMDNKVLKDVIFKKVLKPCERKDRVDYVCQEHGYSLTRACKLINFPRSLYYYVSIKDDTPVIEKLQELAEKKPKEGQDKFYGRIRNAGLIWNRKRIARVYKLLGMNTRKRTRKRLPARIKTPLIIPQQPNDTWSMDFMHDTLMNGRKFRVLNIIDDYNREALKIEPYFSIGSNLVIKILERLLLERGKPKVIRVDNGPEFISSAITEWCLDKNIKLLHVQPGKPMQNGYIERFNRSYRGDVLDANLFENLWQARTLSDEFQEDYNYHRPHESLGNLSPINYKLKNCG